MVVQFQKLSDCRRIRNKTIKEMCKKKGGTCREWQEASIKWPGQEEMTMYTKENINIYTLVSRAIMSTYFTCAAMSSTLAQDPHLR